MVDLNYKLSPDFFREEDICNFHVDPERKKIWAVELDLLCELDRVCKKHDLTYVLSFGSLLGAIRHHGFIPWDDDIDVMMHREDYDKLMKVGPKEFTHPYFFQNPITENSRYFRTHCQLRNSLTTGLISGDEERNINRGIFLDIFVLDKIPSRRAETHYRNAYLLSVISEFLIQCREFSNNNKFSLRFPYQSVLKWIIGKIIHMDNALYFKLWNWHESIYKSRKCDSFVQCLSPKRYRIYDTPAIWSGVEWVDFETMKVPVPSHYNELLTLWYNDWKTPQNIPCVHNGMKASAEISYIDFLYK